MGYNLHICINNYCLLQHVLIPTWDDTDTRMLSSPPVRIPANFPQTAATENQLSLISVATAASHYPHPAQKLPLRKSENLKIIGTKHRKNLGELMLHIPKTNQEHYVSSIVALNIYSPNDTGDWHSSAALSDNAFLPSFYIYGHGQEHNTHHLLGNIGIIDGTNRLNKMG